ncbi:MqnA/MqnD/SBP family protein [Tepidibacillus marianensis]|uniref:MqnA/MqnD/SBP family protein n=1 Tax=Tepidibacillus marianensis TaxID=3131995 RepID=UPI0030CD016F
MGRTEKVVEQYPELLQRIYTEFLNSKNMGYKKRQEIVQATMFRFGGTKEFWEDYFNGLSYEFSDIQVKGLNLYYQMAEQIGVLKRAPKIEVLNMEKHMGIHTY